MSVFKVCTGCGKACHIEDFAFKDAKRGIRRARCRACLRVSAAVASRAHYLRNKDEVVARAAANKAIQAKLLRSVVAEHLRGQKCSCCNSTEDLTFKLIDGHPGPRVSAAVNQGMALDTLLAAIESSTIVCNPCMKVMDAAGLMAYNEAQSKGEVFVGSPLTRAEQKAVRTKTLSDLRRYDPRGGSLVGKVVHLPGMPH